MKIDLRILDIQENVKQLSDNVLIHQADLIVSHERGVTVLALRHLREIEVRRLFIEMGYSSMYECCLKRFKYSEGQTQRRLSSARLMTELPEIEKQIESGDLNITNLSKFQSFVRAEKSTSHNFSKEEKLRLITECENKPTRQVERELIERSHQPALLAEKFHQTTQLLASDPQYTKFEALLDPAQQKLLEEFKNLYAHELQDHGNVSVLNFLLAKAVLHKKKKVGVAAKPKPNAPLPSAANAEVKLKTEVRPEAAPKKDLARKPIKVSVKKHLWTRAQGHCEYHDKKSNLRCLSRFALEVDHIKSIALGGADEISNLQLLCRAHNSRRSIKTFGIYRP